MGHPSIDNHTPFAFQPLLLADEEMRPLVAPLVKATFDLAEDGHVELAPEQRPIDFTGEHYGDPETSALKLEPEFAFTKPRTDVVLIGHAWAPHARSLEVEVDFELGPVSRKVRVTGDRVFEKGLLGARISPPRPFEKIPLCYDRAFGGWDRHHDDPGKHRCEPRNPAGVGFHRRRSPIIDGAPLPNLEDPRRPLGRWGGRSVPAGFGFVSPHWEPRCRLAGTYDEEWERSRSPLLPRDFRREFFNAATPELIAPGHLAGDESVRVSGATPSGRLAFQLPGITPPRIRLARHRRQDETLETVLDTVLVDTDTMQLVLSWRCFAPLWDGPLDILAIEIRCENAPARREPPLPDNVVPIAGPPAPASADSLA